jgi:hypothetical protein
MAAKSPQIRLRGIFRCMMEDGYFPVFERTHIQFGIDDNIAVVEYDEDIVSVRLFFSIDEEAYDLFLEASNSMMIETYIIKPAILDDMKNIMFSCEFMCDSMRDFRRFFPRSIDRLKEALDVHKSKMKKLILASEVAAATIPATEESVAGIARKILS